MAKKKKKARARKKPSVQKQIETLCVLVKELRDRVDQLHSKVDRLRAPNPYQPLAPMPPYGTGPWKPNEVTCRSFDTCPRRGG